MGDRIRLSDNIVINLAILKIAHYSFANIPEHFPIRFQPDRYTFESVQIGLQDHIGPRESENYEGLLGFHKGMKFFAIKRCNIFLNTA